MNTPESKLKLNICSSWIIFVSYAFNRFLSWVMSFQTTIKARLEKDWRVSESSGEDILKFLYQYSVHSKFY